MSLYNEHRIMLWENYQEYTKQLTQIVGTDFYQWINGSFTTKKEYPQDIDLVNFLDYVTFEKTEKNLLNLKKVFCLKISTLIVIL
jgi:hypothetical protein